MKAILTFKTLEAANNFTKAWSRKTGEGHTVGSGLINVQVTVYNVTTDRKNWIDNYVANANQATN